MLQCISLFIRDQGIVEQSNATTELHELPTDISDGRTIMATKVSNRFEIWNEPLYQPHQLDIALRLAFEPTARLNSVQVAVDVDLQQGARMVRGASGMRRLGAPESERP